MNVKQPITSTLAVAMTTLILCCGDIASAEVSKAVLDSTGLAHAD